jgi:beta-lactamase regulating signal transducer with metallopeptidase domain
MLTYMPIGLVLLKVTGFLVIALLATLALQRSSAGTRHLVWLVALAALIVVPVLAIWSPLPVAVLPAPVTQAAPQGPIDTRDKSTAGITTPPSAASVELSGERASLPAATDPSLATILLVIWATVAGILLLRLVYGAWSVRRIVRRGHLLEHPDWQGPLYEIADRLELDAAPRLLRSADVKMPFAAGLLRSTIVLPAESDAWSAERRTAVLIHELGHIRRRDLIGHTLGRVACALYWFHPLVWTAARQLRAESERPVTTWRWFSGPGRVSTPSTSWTS